MSKKIAEQTISLSVFWLKKHGYLNKDYSYNSGSITWTYGYSENKNSIKFSINRDNWGTVNEKTYIRLQYTHTSCQTEEKEEMDYKIQLTTTLCNFGGKRYWFVCPFTKNGRYCGRRVGVIYSIGKYWGCRHCGEIAYSSQMQGGKYKGFVPISDSDIERAKREAKRYYYNGKPTRKYKRYLTKEQKSDNATIMAIKNLKK